MNVFLGLGLAWTIGSAYWAAKGEAGLRVEAGSLGLSVVIFCCCAITCIGILAARRTMYGAELGGRARWPSAACCSALWVLYIILAALKDYGVY